MYSHHSETDSKERGDGEDMLKGIAKGIRIMA